MNPNVSSPNTLPAVAEHVYLVIKRNQLTRKAGLSHTMKEVIWSSDRAYVYNFI